VAAAVCWVRDRKCRETGDRLVEELRTDAFAVGFVSVLSGTLLAAELLNTVVEVERWHQDRNVLFGQHPSCAIAERNWTGIEALGQHEQDQCVAVQELCPESIQTVVAQVDAVTSELQKI
jgi:hypothetical protein